MNNIIIGIDVGFGGGIAVQDYAGDPTTHKMPETLHDMLAAFQEIASRSFLHDADVYVFIEEPPWSMGINKGVGSVKLHYNRGLIQGMCVAMRFKIVNLRPQKWMKLLGIGMRASCASDTEWKNRLKGEAQRIYPNLKITHATADALLILTYGIKELEKTARP